MGWHTASARRRRELLAPDPAHLEALSSSAVGFRDTPHCLSTQNFAIDLSALIRRLGAAIPEPSVAVVAAAVMSSLPPLDLGSEEEPMNLLMALDWPAAHTPARANVNRARARPALVAANRLTVTDIGPETPLNFESVMATSALKRHFFALCGNALRDRMCRLPAKNLVITLLASTGEMHTARFDNDGILSYEQTARESGYGEADLEIPMYMRRIAPDKPWELQTIDWDSGFVVALLGMNNVTVRLSKTEDPADGRKRKRAVHEIINGERLCTAWPNVGTVFCRMGQGDTDYSKGLGPYGLKGLLKKEAEMNMALFVDEENRLMLDLKAFVAVIAASATHKARRVYIGPDQTIHLTSKPGTRPCERPLEMLHDNLIKLLWTVAYFRAAGYDEDRIWKGPDPSLYGLRLWGRGATREEAFSGSTTPAALHCLGRVPA